MTKENNIEKAYDFGASEFNRKMKRITQDRLKRGLLVSLDIPNDATPEELEELKAFDAWTRDGQPVEDWPLCTGIMLLQVKTGTIYRYYTLGRVVISAGSWNPAVLLKTDKNSRSKYWSYDTGREEIHKKIKSGYFDRENRREVYRRWLGRKIGTVGARPNSSQNDSEDAKAEASRKIELSTEETKSRSD